MTITDQPGRPCAGLRHGCVGLSDAFGHAIGAIGNRAGCTLSRGGLQRLTGDEASVESPPEQERSVIHRTGCFRSPRAGRAEHPTHPHALLLHFRNVATGCSLTGWPLPMLSCSAWSMRTRPIASPAH